MISSPFPAIDTRPAAEFAAAHVPGTVNIPLDRAFTTWAGWLVPYTVDFCLIVDDRCTPPGPTRFAAAGGFTEWQAAGQPVEAAQSAAAPAP